VEEENVHRGRSATAEELPSISATRKLPATDEDELNRGKRIAAGMVRTPGRAIDANGPKKLSLML